MEIKEYLDGLLRDSFILDEALVVGPYPSPGFFDQLCSSDGNSKYGYPRSKLTILADDGWDQGRLDEISEIFQKCKGNKNKTVVTILRVAPENRQGLVHAKLYFLKLTNEARTYSRRILLVGSANASNQGFGVHAETFVSIDLADIDGTEKRGIVKYLQALESGQDVDSICFSVGAKKDSWMMLPSIKSVSNHRQSGFDAWLRRGRLCHKYQRDQSFGKLTLRLKSALPKTDLEIGLNNFGFGADLDSQAFSRPYVSFSSESESDQRVVWRKRYFVETYYGYWVSAECYDNKKDEFTESCVKERGNALSLIKKASPVEQSAWLDEFQKSIENMADQLAHHQKAEDDFKLGGFFEIADSRVNVDAYRNKAKEKLKYDQSRTQDAIFVERFKSGYAFPRMPQLGDEFEEFALDFCQNLLAKMRSRSVANCLAQKLKNYFNGDIPESAEKLRSDWKLLGSNVVAYYNDMNVE